MLGTAKHVAVILLIFVGSWFLGGAAYWLTWDPIGEGNDLGPPPCKTAELSPVPNGKGEIATLRRTWCSGNRDGDFAYFVFVHRADDANSKQNLVFRYEPGYERYTFFANEPPKITWTSDSALRITVAGAIQWVTQRRAKSDGITIIYALGREACPASLTRWRRLWFEWGGFWSCSVT
jgi:hypothetical protein